MANTFAYRKTIHPRYLAGLVVIGACSYAIDRWFFSGLFASKWIGLPQYERAMHELQGQSMRWGTAALLLEIMALALVLPKFSRRNKNDAVDKSLIASREGNVWLAYLGKCVLCGGAVAALAIAFAVIIPFGATLIGKLLGRP
jgi:hypothetical protein